MAAFNPHLPTPGNPHGWFAQRYPKAIAVFVGTMLLLLAIDLVSKNLSFEYVAGEPVALEPGEPADVHLIPPHPPISVVPNVLALRLTLNRGAVFGVMQGKVWFFVVVSIGAICLIGWMFARSYHGAYGLHISLGLLLAGALGNLYDRMVYSAVRDMLYLFPGVDLPFGLAWPGGNTQVYPWIFNVADVALVVGVILTLVLVNRHELPQPDAEKAQDAKAPARRAPDATGPRRRTAASDRQSPQ